MGLTRLFSFILIIVQVFGETDYKSATHYIFISFKSGITFKLCNIINTHTNAAIWSFLLELIKYTICMVNKACLLNQKR